MLDRDCRPFAASNERLAAGDGLRATGCGLRASLDSSTNQVTKQDGNGSRGRARTERMGSASFCAGLSVICVVVPLSGCYGKTAAEDAELRALKPLNGL